MKGRKKMEEEMVLDVSNTDAMEGYTPVEKNPTEETKEESPIRGYDPDETISCLRNERVRVQYVNRERTGLTDPSHPFYGGLADGAKIAITIPMLRNGTYTDPLTKSEKAFLEEYLGMEPNALSVHNKKNNFWDTFYVEIGKEGEVLDLSVPMDYIKYAVLKANKALVAPSMKELKEMPKETYRFVIVTDSEVSRDASEKVSTKAKCWKEYGKIEDNKDVLRTVLETLASKPVDSKSKLEFLQEKVTDFIESDSRTFLRVVSDELLPIRVLLRKAVDVGVVEKRGDYYYYNNTPLCNKNENPTITVAARFLLSPKNQEMRFAIEGKVNN